MNSSLLLYYNIEKRAIEKQSESFVRREKKETLLFQKKVNEQKIIEKENALFLHVVWNMNKYIPWLVEEKEHEQERTKRLHKMRNEAQCFYVEHSEGGNGIEYRYSSFTGIWFSTSQIISNFPNLELSFRTISYNEFITFLFLLFLLPFKSNFPPVRRLLSSVSSLFLSFNLSFTHWTLLYFLRPSLKKIFFSYPSWKAR